MTAAMIQYWYSYWFSYSYSYEYCRQPSSCLLVRYGTVPYSYCLYNQPCRMSISKERTTCRAIFKFIDEIHKQNLKFEPTITDIFSKSRLWMVVSSVGRLQISRRITLDM